MSYLVEALNCYVAGLHKAAAVMSGVAAEGVILVLRDEIVEKLAAQGKPVSKDLKGWMLRPMTIALTDVFERNIDPRQERELREQFDTYWAAFTGQIRITRNEAGHPASIEPVTADTVHASLLIFPELAVLGKTLSEWIAERL